MGKPLFSIVVPIYNIEDYLSECVDSILRQSYPNFELILVDDGSCDSSGLLCDRYQSSDPRIVVIHEPNGGIVKARISGLEKATGDYLICVDGDDWIDENYLLNAVRIIEEYDPDIIAFGYHEVFSDKTLDRTFDSDRFMQKDEIVKDIFPRLIYGKKGPSFPNSIWAKVYKKELYDINQRTVDNRIMMGEDTACVVPCITEANSIYCSKQCIYYYRHHDHNFSKAHKPLPIDGPKLVEQHLKQALKDIDYDFSDQIRRRTVRALFNVVVTQFFRKEKRIRVLKQIKQTLKDPFYEDSIRNASFGKKSTKLIHFSIKYKVTILFYMHYVIRNGL